MLCFLKQFAYICNIKQEHNTNVQKIIEKMKAAYNKSLVMKNAWYMFRVHMAKDFAEALRKAWANEKRRHMYALIEGRDLAAEDARAQQTTYRPERLAAPDDYYGVPGRYYGD